jgi:hypothetical protein
MRNELVTDRVPPTPIPSPRGGGEVRVVTPGLGLLAVRRLTCWTGGQPPNPRDIFGQMMGWAHVPA